MNGFDIGEHSIVFDLPRKIEASAWLEHIPFAFFLISLLKPRIFVEIGVYNGTSFNAFCQAVKRTGGGIKCYGVDTWKGDEHAGFYDDTIYNRLLEYQQKEFAFASLLRMTFDEALDRFDDGTIDLLHIDGYHTYEAVKHDFESWLPKMSQRGVVILHDTQVREQNFGVWRLWEDLSRKYPSFNFSHGYGLGVVFVGGDGKCPALEFIEKANRQDFLQYLFARLGKGISLEMALLHKDDEIRELATRKDDEIRELATRKDDEIRELATRKDKVIAGLLNQIEEEKKGVLWKVLRWCRKHRKEKNDFSERAL